MHGRQHQENPSPGSTLGSLPARYPASPPHPGSICNQPFSQHSVSIPKTSACLSSFLFFSCFFFPIRWQQTSKSSGLSSSLQPAGAKADALREEMEEAANRVEICRVPTLFAPILLGHPGECPWEVSSGSLKFFETWEVCSRTRMLPGVSAHLAASILESRLNPRAGGFDSDRDRKGGCLGPSWCSRKVGRETMGSLCKTSESQRRSSGSLGKAETSAQGGILTHLVSQVASSSPCLLEGTGV